MSDETKLLPQLGWWVKPSDIFGMEAALWDGKRIVAEFYRRDHAEQMAECLNRRASDAARVVPATEQIDVGRGQPLPSLSGGPSAHKEHVASRDCWCCPEQDALEPSVWLHRMEH